MYGVVVVVVVADGPRPDRDEIIKLRSFMLMYVKELILKGQGILEDELQSILNYLTTLHEVRINHRATYRSGANETKQS